MQTCPDCKGTLEKGCILDHTYGMIIASRYAHTDTPETPEKHIMMFHESEFKDVRRVVTYRCTRCNRLFSYAQDFVITPNLTNRNNRFFLWMIGGLSIFVILSFLFLFFVE